MMIETSLGMYVTRSWRICRILRILKLTQIDTDDGTLDLSLSRLITSEG